MKRFLLLGSLLLAMGRTAFCYTNDAVIQVPPMPASVIQIQDPVFVNNGTFNVTIPQAELESTFLYTTYNTLDYINNGSITVSPGFDFENFPDSAGQFMAANFINNGSGPGGGVITAVNTFGGLNIFQQPPLFGTRFPVDFGIVGLAQVKIRATNVVNSGTITMDSTGLIDILGSSVNLDHAQMVMTGAGGTTVLDSGAAGFGTNTAHWFPATDLMDGQATSPVFFTNDSGQAVSVSTFGQTYFENLTPQPGADGIVVWRVVYLEDFSPPNVQASVYFGGGGGAGAFHIQWAGSSRDPFTGGTSTNYLLLNDDPSLRRGRGYFPRVAGTIPPDFSFSQGPTPQITGTPADPGFAPEPFAPAEATNDWSYVLLQSTALSVDTNQVVGGSVTNLPGRIQLTSLDTLNLANAHISGPNYLSVKAPVNYLGNSNSQISARYSDFDLGSASGSLTFSNLLSPVLPAWTGEIQAFSGSYFFVDTNGAAPVTNDVRVLMVNSSLLPTSPALQQNVTLRAPHDVVIADELNIFNSFFSDTASLTVTTNDNNAYSPTFGILNFVNSDIFWSASLPNLQYLTNWGQITTENLANFAGNMFTQFSPRSGATPYQAFVNHGTITDEGVFVRANYFENTGLMQEPQFGNIDINAGTAIINNGVLDAPAGTVSLVGNSLFVSNSVINAARTLTLTPSCSLSDGYVFGNQFGHATNAILPHVVTNGNIWSAGGGVRVTQKPATADLLGTTIINTANNNLNSINQWAGEDRGPNPSGFADNLALGRMVFVSDQNPSQFTFSPVTGNNALYVDLIDFEGGAAVSNGVGDLTAFNIQPGMKIYYAQALVNGVSIAEKLNGKNGGGFMWVSNYAGVYSSTNIGGTLYNQALAVSPNIDSDNDTVVNVNDTTPFPPGLTFDNSPIGPQPCSGGTQPPGTPEPPVGGGNGANALDILAFPAHHSGSGSNSVSLALVQGSYTGLFYKTNGINPASSGFFSANVTGKGTFSAKLQIGAKTYSVGGKFNQAGNFTGSAMGKGVMSLKLSLHLADNNEIVGQVSSGTSWTAQLLAVTKAPTTAGKNSLVLSVNSDNSTTPSGDSFGTVTLKKTGDIQWSGVLPDGVKVTQKSVLSKDGVWPLYSSLYGGSGSLIGWLQLTNGNTDISGSAVWIMPPNQSDLYKNGLTNEFKATGSSLSSPSGTSGSSSTMMIFTGPQLIFPVTNSVTISGSTGQSPDNSLTLSVDTKNGLFTGSVVDPSSSQKLSFQGALLEKSGVGGGFFLNATKDQGGKVYLAPAN